MKLFDFFKPTPEKIGSTPLEAFPRASGILTQSKAPLAFPDSDTLTQCILLMDSDDFSRLVFRFLGQETEIMACLRDFDLHQEVYHSHCLALERAYRQGNGKLMPLSKILGFLGNQLARQALDAGRPSAASPSWHHHWWDFVTTPILDTYLEEDSCPGCGTDLAEPVIELHRTHGNFQHTVSWKIQCPNCLHVIVSLQAADEGRKIISPSSGSPHSPQVKSPGRIC